MSYYNPKIYNYSNLKKEDKLYIDAMMAMLEELKEIKFDYIEEKIPIIEQMVNEISLEVLKDAIEKLKHKIIEFIVAIIDHYDEDVELRNTDDYFYGCE